MLIYFVSLEYIRVL